MNTAPMSSERPAVLDRVGRPLRSLRLSVTDRCNLRCRYCMPEKDYVWLPRETLLTFEEMAMVTERFTDLGVEKVRLTGGEPLLRKDLPILIRLLRKNSCINDLAVTTNGILLAEQAQALYEAGLHRVTVSLDTLQPERFHALTKQDRLAHVLMGIEAVTQAGFTGLKLDTVVMRGFNEDELSDLIEYGKRVGGEVRFIEYMDVGGATEWSMSQVLSRQAMLAALARRYGRIEPVIEESSAPAQRFRLSDGTTFGIISSTTAPFCSTCDRSRLTADGMWFLCLYALRGVDVRLWLRTGLSREDMTARLRAGWQGRADRGAEQRHDLERVGIRASLVTIERLREDPRLEMHTRGG